MIYSIKSILLYLKQPKVYFDLMNRPTCMIPQNCTFKSFNRIYTIYTNSFSISVLEKCKDLYILEIIQHLI